MKPLLFRMLCPLTLLAQWSDNFSTDLSNWTGDTAFFEIDTINQLHLNAPAVANTTYLWRQSTSVFNGEWAFYVQMDFNPISIEPVLFSPNNDGQDDLLQVKISLGPG